MTTESTAPIGDYAVPGVPAPRSDRRERVGWYVYD